MLDIDPAKEERLRRTLAPYFVAIDVASVDYTMRLTHGEAADLVMMTPRAGHTTENDIEHDMASALPSEVTVSVLVTAYQPQ
jgi:23S rRNA (guanine745-N1)-methyltransferase